VPSGAPSSGKQLAREFFARPAAEVAPALLGCVLTRDTPEGLVAVELTEAEAYAGSGDPASHAYRGMTGRNAVMFGPPGYAYVYFTYGMHYCVNVVCQPVGTPEAVLLRAGRVIAGAELAARRRYPAVPHGNVMRSLAQRDLARGPARLCQALAITRDQDGADLCSADGALRMRPAAPAVRMDDQRRISEGPRVGVTAAADTPWRFWVAGDPTVSVYRPAAKRDS
jgi:DNA-3-methyladenine glycosylase